MSTITCLISFYYFIRLHEVSCLAKPYLYWSHPHNRKCPLSGTHSISIQSGVQTNARGSECTRTAAQASSPSGVLVPLRVSLSLSSAPVSSEAALDFVRLEPALGAGGERAVVLVGAVLCADQLVHPQVVAAVLARRERRALLRRAHAAVEQVREARLACLVLLRHRALRLRLAPRARHGHHSRQQNRECALHFEFSVLTAEENRTECSAVGQTCSVNVMLLKSAIKTLGQAMLHPLIRIQYSQSL